MKPSTLSTLIPSSVKCWSGLLVLAAGPVYAWPFAAPATVWSGDSWGPELLRGDVNGDTLPDLAVVAGETNLLWFVNTGAGNFTPSHSLSVAGWNLAGAQAGDLDGDGDTDVVLIVADPADAWGIGQVAVFRNNGGTGFTKTQQFATGGFTTSNVVIPLLADLDNDGDLDLAYTYRPDFDNSHLAWCRNNGSGNLAAPVLLDSNNGLEFNESINAGDFNGDGKTDLCLTLSQDGITGQISSVINLYTGMGQGNFGVPLRSKVPTNTTGASMLADVNRDGRPDLVSTSTMYNNGIRLRLNTGAGFDGGTSLAAGMVAASKVAAGDLDEDGDPDFLFGEATGGVNSLSWLGNNGNGSFQPKVTMATGFEKRIEAVLGLDADGDGDTDVAVKTTNGLFMMLNQSIHRSVEPAFTNANRATVLTGEPRLVSADFDRDGEQDLAVLSPDNGTVRWMPVNGSGIGAEITVSTAAAGSTAFAAGDVTGDGLPDLVVSMPAQGQIHLLRNVGNGATWQTSVLPALPDVSAIRLADVDADGSLDVVASSYSNYKTILFRNVNRDGTVWTQEQVATLNAMDQILPVQLQKPGRMEILLTSYDPEAGICEVRRAAYASGAWSVSLLAQGDAGSSLVAAGDLNGDGTNDLVRSLGFGTGWQPNYNNGAFNAAQTITGFPAGMRCGSLADLNGDGKPDLVAAGSGKVVCAMNTGNGTFAAPLTLFTAAGEAFRDLVILDLEQDGDLDIAVADAASDRVRILINRAGQYDTVSAAPLSGQPAWPGGEKTLITSAVQHLGAPADQLLTVRNFRVRLQRGLPQANGSYGYGAALTAAEAASVLEKLEICRDLGVQGSYQSGIDLVVASETSFSTVNDGYINLTAPAGQQAAVTCGPGQTMNFLVRAKLKSTSAASSVDYLISTLLCGTGGSLVSHTGTSPDWELRKRGASGNISAMLVVQNPTGLQQWRMTHFGTWEGTGSAANEADPDGDGTSNLIEYVMGRHPTIKESIGGAPAVELVYQGINQPLKAVLRLTAVVDPKIDIQLQQSANLTTWTDLARRTGDTAWTGVVPSSGMLAGGRVLLTFISGTIPAATPRFNLRLKVSELP